MSAQTLEQIGIFFKKNTFLIRIYGATSFRSSCRDDLDNPVVKARFPSLWEAKRFLRSARGDALMPGFMTKFSQQRIVVEDQDGGRERRQRKAPTVK